MHTVTSDAGQSIASRLDFREEQFRFVHDLLAGGKESAEKAVGVLGAMASDLERASKQLQATAKRLQELAGALRVSHGLASKEQLEACEFVLKRFERALKS
jgi:hypothetical protein